MSNCISKNNISNVSSDNDISISEVSLISLHIPYEIKQDIKETNNEIDNLSLLSNIFWTEYYYQEKYKFPCSCKDCINPSKELKHLQ